MTPLTTSQTALLAILRKGRATTAQLAAATERADRDVLASLHRLQDHGLIRREPAGGVLRYWEAVP